MKDTRLDNKYSTSSFNDMWMEFGRKLYLKALLKTPSLLLSEYQNANRFMATKSYICTSDQFKWLDYFGMPELREKYGDGKFNTYELFFFQCMLLKCFSGSNKPHLTPAQIIDVVIDQNEYFDVKNITNYSVRFGWIITVICILLIDIISAVLLPFWASFIAIILFNMVSLVAYTWLYIKLKEGLYSAMYRRH